MILRTISGALLASGVLAGAIVAQTVAHAADETFTDLAGDAVHIDDSVLAFDPEINPSGTPLSAHPADITSVTVSVADSVQICVVRPNKTAVDPIFHVGILLEGAGIFARLKLEDGVVTTFVDDLDDNPLSGTGITLATSDAGQTVCLDAPLSLASSITGIQAVSYDRPSAQEERGWDRTALFPVQLQVPSPTATATATSTSTPTPTASATTTPTSTPSATATVAPSNTPTTAPATTVPTSTATARATAVAPGPPATGTGPGNKTGGRPLLYAALALAVVGAGGLILSSLARRGQ
jgi:hypothetical protein